MKNKSGITSLKDLSHVHMIGIGGIGMSSIAQYLVDLNIKVTGSDRAISNPENMRIFEPLKKKGVKIFQQDGSYSEEGVPDVLIYSTAIEDDNPDIQSISGIPLFHRSEILALCIKNESHKISIAVSGSCGKTTVTAWLSETLTNAGFDPIMIGGGISKSLAAEDLVGNYRPGNGKFIVFEADESDKSLVNYKPDYSLILNIGTDHYDKNELIDMFQEFSSKTTKGAVVSRDVYDLLGADCFKEIDLCIFDDKQNSSVPVSDIKTYTMEKYSQGWCQYSLNKNDTHFKIKLPLPGRHSGLNAAAVFCLMDIVGLNNDKTIMNIENFMGVWRRSDFAGFNTKGAKIYDDYAHNVEKMISSINTAREGGKRVIAIFQPHGFKPLGFMRDSLFNELEKNLEERDIFCMLPVYYAGGSASFSPTAEEVIKSYITNGLKKYCYFDSRKQMKLKIEEMSTKDDIILIMGARDNSLSDFAHELTC